MKTHTSRRCSDIILKNFLTAVLAIMGVAGVAATTSLRAQTAAPTPTANSKSQTATTTSPNATTARTPSDAVREFYKAMRERRYRDAFAISIYRPAVEPLSASEFEDLRPDFEKIAAAIPEKVEISGEQISGDTATVFVTALSGDNNSSAPEKIDLVRVGGTWIVGDRENGQIVEKSGKKFFFDTRIETHHGEVREMMQRIVAAQLIYGSQHEGVLGDLNDLVRAGLVPQDLLSTESTGYHFHVTLVDNKKSYQAGAEPASYGRTGRLSFYLDPSGMRSEDKGGKPLKAPSSKK